MYRLQVEIICLQEKFAYLFRHLLWDWVKWDCEKSIYFKFIQNFKLFFALKNSLITTPGRKSAMTKENIRSVAAYFNKAMTLGGLSKVATIKHRN